MNGSCKAQSILLELQKQYTGLACVGGVQKQPHMQITGPALTFDMDLQLHSCELLQLFHAELQQLREGHC